MEETLNVQELIKLESLPKIFYQLEEIGKVVDNALVGIEDMVCNDDNKKEVKKRKQEITAFKNMMEDRRKQIKNQVMAKYDEFNKKYEEEVKSKLVNAENILNEKVSTIENQQKLDKENELRTFADQWFISKGIENIVKFEDIKLNITLTASIKSLKEQVVDFVDRIFNDIKLIELEEYKDEIMFEYKQTLDFTNSKLKVIERHKEIEYMQQLQKKAEEEQKQNDIVVQKVEETIKEVEEITTPKEIIEEDEVIIVTFTIKDTKEKIIKVRDFMKEEGINYE